MALTPEEIKEWRKPLSDTWLNPAPTLYRRLQKALDALEEAQRKRKERVARWLPRLPPLNRSWGNAVIWAREGEWWGFWVKQDI